MAATELPRACLLYTSGNLSQVLSSFLTHFLELFSGMFEPLQGLSLIHIFAANGARVTLKTMPFRDHAEYFAHDFGCAIGVAPDRCV